MATINLLPWRDGLREQRKNNLLFSVLGSLCWGLPLYLLGGFI